MSWRSGRKLLWNHCRCWIGRDVCWWLSLCCSHANSPLVLQSHTQAVSSAFCHLVGWIFPTAPADWRLRVYDSEPPLNAAVRLRHWPEKRVTSHKVTFLIPTVCAENPRHLWFCSDDLTRRLCIIFSFWGSRVFVFNDLINKTEEAIPRNSATLKRKQMPGQLIFKMVLNADGLPAERTGQPTPLRDYFCHNNKTGLRGSRVSGTTEQPAKVCSAVISARGAPR